MYKLYKDGKDVSIDKDQIEIFVANGWSIEPPEVVAEEAKVDTAVIAEEPKADDEKTTTTDDTKVATDKVVATRGKKKV